KANDTVDNQGFENVSSVEVDNTPPSVSFDTPSNGDAVTDSFYLNTTIADNLGNGNSSTYRYRISNSSGVLTSFQQLNSGSGDKYYTEIDSRNYAEGIYTLNVSAEDVVGNLRTRSIQVSFDNEPPQVNITSPRYYSVKNGSVGIEADVYDKAGNLEASSIFCRISGSGWQTMNYFSSSDTAECSIDSTTLANGVHKMEVKANDSLDQKGLDSTGIHIDNQDPQNIQIDANETVVQSGDPVKVNVTADEPNLLKILTEGLEASKYLLYSEEFESYSNGANPSGWTEVSGDWEVYNGDYRLSSVGDGVAVSDGSWTNLSYSTEVKMSEDDSAGLFIRYSDSNNFYRIEFANNKTGDNSASFNGIRLVEESSGSSYVKESNTDIHFQPGNYYNLRVAASGSTIKVYWEGEQVLATSTAETWNGKIGTYSLNQQPSYKYFNVSKQGFRTSTVPADGEVNVEVLDEAGNKASSAYNLIIDNEPPEFSQLSRNVSYMRTGETVRFQAYINDSNLDTSTPNISVVDSSQSFVKDIGESCSSVDSNIYLCNGTWSGKASGSAVGNGNYSFKVFAEDEADNTNSTIYEKELTVDNTDPSYSNLLINDTYINDSQVIRFSSDVTDLTFNGSAADVKAFNVSSPGQVFDTGESCSGSGTSFSCETVWNPSGEGNYSFSINSTDKAGNFEYRELNDWFFHDTSRPVLWNGDTNDSIVQTGQDIEAWAKASDNTEVYEVVADSSTQLSFNGSHWRGVVEAEPDEAVNLTAYDLANNSGSLDIDYTVDNTPPVVENFTSNATIDIASSFNTVNFTVNSSDQHLNSTEIENISSGGFTDMNLIGGEKYSLAVKPEKLGLDSGGSYNLTVRSTDKASNTAEDYYILGIDNGDPTITSIDLNNTVFRPNTAVKANVSLVEKHPDTVKANGHSMSEQNGFWITDLVLNRSTQNPVNISAVDIVGNRDWNLSDQYYIDDTSPTIHSFKVNASYNVSRSTDTVNFKVNASDTHLKNVSINGTKLENNTVWEKALKPTDLGCPTGTVENCSLQAVAVDKAGNTVQETFNLTVDDVIPEVKNPWVNSTVVNSGDTVNFSATINDHNLNRSGVINFTSAICSLGSSTGFNSCTSEIYSSGSYIFSAEDKAGNLNISRSIDIAVDDTPPSISGFSSNATFNTSRSNASVKFNASVTDQHLKNVSINGTGLVNNTGSEWSLEAEPQALGCPQNTESTCILQLKAVDRAENVNTSIYSLKVDDVRPQVNYVDINETVIQSDSSVEAYVNVSGESNSSLKSVEAEGEQLSWNGTMWTAAVQVDNDGIVNVSATDNAGNKGFNNTVSYTVDDTSPSIPVFGSNASYNYSRSDKVLNFSVEASDQHLEAVEILNKSSGNYLEMNNVSGSYSFQASPESLGCSSSTKQKCTLRAKASDRADNTELESYNLTVDDVDPVISEVEVNDSIVKPNAVVYLSANISNEDHLDLLDVSAEGEALSFNGINWSSQVQVDNDEVFNVSATDKASNTGENGSVDYIVDTERPDVSNLNSSDPDDVLRGDQDANFTVNVSDENGVDDVSIEGVSMQEGSGEWFVFTSPQNLGCLPGTVCNLTATAVDNAGWTNSTNYSIKVDDSAPVMGDLTALNATGGTPETAKEEWFLEWEANATDFSNLTVELFAENRSTGQIVGNKTVLNQVDQDTYREVEKVGYFNASNGTFRFRAKAIDSAGNVNSTTYLLEVSAQPPRINNIFVTDKRPEEDRQQFQIKANVTDTNTISVVNATVTGPGVTDQKEMKLVQPQPNMTGGIYATNYTATESGDYSVEISTKDATNEANTDSRSQLFKAIGKTTGAIKVNASKTLFDNITQENYGNFTVERVYNNTGLVTAYDAEITRLNSPEGFFSNSSRVNCGDISNSSTCKVVEQVNITPEASTGLLNVYSTAGWINPDYSSGAASNTTVFRVLPNPVLKDLYGDTSAKVYWNKSENVSGFKLQNFGNVRLEDVEVVEVNDHLGSKTIQEGEYTVHPSTLDLGVGENITLPVEIDINEKGSYRFRLRANATGNSANCDSDSCTVTKDISLNAYRKLDLNLLNGSGELFRDNYTLEAEVTNEEGLGVDSYTVGFYDNDTFIGNVSTSSSGVASTDWNAWDEDTGVHNVSVKIWDNKSRYLEAGNSSDFSEVSLNDSLSLAQTLQDTDMYWYEDPDDNVTLNYSVTDRFGRGVEDATVKLFTNASGSFEQVETCVTGPGGDCSIVWNTDISQKATAKIRSMAVKNRFYSSSGNKTGLVDILGGFSVSVLSPSQGGERSSDLNLVVDTLQDLNASVKDQNGDSVNPEQLNWTINTSTGSVQKIAEGKTTNWTVDSLGYGVHNLTATAGNQSKNASETVLVKIYEPSNATITSTSSSSVARNSSVNITAQVNNSRTGSAIKDYRCSFYNNNNLIGNSSTDSGGLCKIRWNTSQANYVGPHNVSVKIEEKRTSTEWYLPVENSSNAREIDVTEQLEINITRPEGIINSFTTVSLNSTVENRFGSFENANVSWRSNITGSIGLGANTSWKTDGTARGPHNLTAEAFYGNYTNGTDSKVVEVFGWSSIKFNASGSHLKGSNVNVPVRVENAETGNGIGNYNVTVYRKNESASSFKKLDRSSTNINGWANFTWDTSNVALGNHTLKASINDSENLFFNATEFNETSKVFIGGSLQPGIEQVDNRTVYRDRFSTPRATNITVNVS
ncbi:MAG: hypothetical protein ABEJ93_02180, partial [Candidatus Nanohalobium sp.]